MPAEPLKSLTQRPTFGVLRTDSWLELPACRVSVRQLEKRTGDAAPRPTPTTNLTTSQAVTIGKTSTQAFRLDGELRAARWTRNAAEAPPSVLTTVYEARNETEIAKIVDALYPANQAIAEHQKIQRALKRSDTVLRSRLLSRGYMSVALNIAMRGAPASQQFDCAPLNTADAALYFRQEIEMLDSIDPQPSIFDSGVTAAALLALSVFPDELEFFSRLNTRLVRRSKGRLDPIGAVLECIQRPRDDLDECATDTALIDHCGRTLRGFDAWRQRNRTSGAYWFRYTIRAMPVFCFIEKARKAKNGKSSL